MVSPYACADAGGNATVGGDPGLLVPGRNCWRVERAGRVAVLVDGAAYFAAFRAAAARAQRSLFIAGWDVDSRASLAPEGAADGLPEHLGKFLEALLARRRSLRVHVLAWDFAMLFALQREWLPVFKFNLHSHGRLRFRLDGAHPVGASHHQKLVVVDDRIAFVGGLDLTARRWDTPAHRAVEPGRRAPDGTPYPPFHDVQMLVDGDAARAIGELARERWRRATGTSLPIPRGAPDADPWPPGLAPDVTRVGVGIARTEPALDGRAQVGEIRQFYLDAIAAARRCILLENQYFSSAAIAGALAQRLGAAAGPEVVLVSRRHNGGWLEETTMGALRARQHRRLQQTDTGGRYRAYCPEVPGLGDACVNVHSKLLVVDDELLTVGSANLSNRSMGFDTECNLVLQAAGNEATRRAIAGLRHRLLAEHLAVTPDEFATAERHGSTIAAIETLRGNDRTLAPLQPVVAPEVDALLPETALIDPERPIDPDRLLAEVVPPEEEQAVHARFPVAVLILVALLALAAAWRWTPLGEWLDLDTLLRAAGALREAPAAPLLLVGTYVVAGFVVFPVTVLIAATLLVFGPAWGILYAMAGATASALVTFAIGQRLGRDAVRRLAGTRLNRLSRRLARRGVLTIVAIRLVPVAPFSVVNLVAGASHIGVRDFLLGTLLGLAPGVLGLALFFGGVTSALSDPGAGTFAAVAVVLAALAAAVYALRRWVTRRASCGPRQPAR